MSEASTRRRRYLRFARTIAARGMAGDALHKADRLDQHPDIQFYAVFIRERCKQKQNYRHICRPQTLAADFMRLGAPQTQNALSPACRCSEIRSASASQVLSDQVTAPVAVLDMPINFANGVRYLATNPTPWSDVTSVTHQCFAAARGQMRQSLHGRAERSLVAVSHAHERAGT